MALRHTSDFPVTNKNTLQCNISYKTKYLFRDKGIAGIHHHSKCYLCSLIVTSYTVLYNINLTKCDSTKCFYCQCIEQCFQMLSSTLDQVTSLDPH